MRWLGIFLGALALVVGVGLWIRSGLEDARGPLAGFCVTLRAGEPWAPALRRAEERALRFEPVSPKGASIQELRAERDAFGRRFGCTVFVEGGRVTSSVSSELPSR